MRGVFVRKCAPKYEPATPWRATSRIRNRPPPYLPAMIEGHFETKASSPANATGEGNRFTPRCSNADRHKDDARPNRFQEPLNDTTGRTKRVFRKTPPPPINRHQSTSEIGSEDIVCGSARRNRFFEPLNDTTARPTRVFRKTPPPPIIRGVSTSGVLTGEEEEKVEKDACLRLQSSTFT